MKTMQKTRATLTPHEQRSIM
jgi:hypothetical protein